MKKLILSIVAMLAMSFSINAQEFQAPKKVKEAYTDTTTTYTYRIDTNVYKVYRSRSGAYYIYKTSKKTGKLYKYYLPKEVQKQMGRKYEDD